MSPNEQAESLWRTFAATGSVSDYLRYKEALYGSDRQHAGTDHQGEQQYR